MLHAGQIPEVYKEVIEGIEIEEVRRKVVDEKAERAAIDGTALEMRQKAVEGYFCQKSR